MTIMLPQLAVIKSNLSYNKHLRYNKEGHVNVNVGFISNSEPDVFNTFSKIEVETAKVDERYVHLRFCHSNKYWSKSGVNLYGTNKPEEDTSKSSCTLFEPFTGSDGKLAFRHLQSGEFLAASITGDNNDLVRFREVQSDRTSFSYVDWDSLVVMPRYVAFKANNAKYGSASWNGSHMYIQFSSEDGNATGTAHEVTMLPDGHIRLKANLNGRFWRLSPSWIWADSDDTSSNNRDTLFMPVKIGDNIIGLRNAGNNLFCKRLTADGKNNCLNASVDTVTAEARLQVEELVLDKQIYDVRFRMEDARTYDETPIVLGSEEGENHTYELKPSQSITVNYAIEKSSTFTNSLSLKLGIKTEITTGIPFIAEGKIEVSAEISTGFEWSSTTTEKIETSATFLTDIPPRTKVTVQYVATKGKCDVPFSYKVKERLSHDGSIIYNEYDDGLFTGINSYNYHFNEPETEPLPL